MTFEEYSQYFESLLNGNIADAPEPYNNPEYREFTKLNWSRTNRWIKSGVLSDAIKTAAAGITKPQSWSLITEPWCGDAGQIAPFIELISRLNPLISLSYELRDSEPFSINNYLTNGAKAIPILVIRDANGTDLAVWGPRPAAGQNYRTSLVEQNLSSDAIKEELQNWYNQDKGAAIQQDLAEVLNRINQH